MQALKISAGASDFWIDPLVARAQRGLGSDPALAASVFAFHADVARLRREIPSVRDIAAAGQTAIRARSVALETNAPIGFVVGVKCSAVTDLLAILTGEMKSVLTGVGKRPVGGGGGP